MPTITFSVERELPCECLVLANTPFSACPLCDGSGVSWQEIEVEVEYSHTRAYRGARDRLGVPLEPDEPESVEILNTTVELTQREMARAEEACLQDYNERAEDALISRYEDR